MTRPPVSRVGTALVGPCVRGGCSGATAGVGSGGGVWAFGFSVTYCSVSDSRHPLTSTSGAG